MAKPNKANKPSQTVAPNPSQSTPPLKDFVPTKYLLWIVPSLIVFGIILAILLLALGFTPTEIPLGPTTWKVPNFEKTVVVTEPAKVQTVLITIQLPTNTQLPTYTIIPSSTAYPTHTRLPTYTPYPTYTAIPTFTPTSIPEGELALSDLNKWNSLLEAVLFDIDANWKSTSKHLCSDHAISISGSWKDQWRKKFGNKIKSNIIGVIPISIKDIDSQHWEIKQIETWEYIGTLQSRKDKDEWTYKMKRTTDSELRYCIEDMNSTYVLHTPITK